MKKEEPTPKSKEQEKVKPIETPKPEPKQEKSTAKQHFAEQFSCEKERISGKPFKGEPTIEDAGDSPALQKYYKNWTLSEA